MRSSLGKLWTSLFVALVQLPVAAVVGVLVGKTDLSIWVMGMAAHHAVRSVGGLSFARRLAIWSTAMTAGSVTVWLGAVAISLLMQFTANSALNASGQVTSVFWLVASTRLAIGWAPVVVAWAVSRALVRRSTRREQVVSPAELRTSAPL